jgi:hypothetical protein
LLLPDIDRQIGLTERLARPADDSRHPAHITAALRPSKRRDRQAGVETSARGLAGNAVLSRLAKPRQEQARKLHATHCELAWGNRQSEPSATRTYHDLGYPAKTWSKAFRVVLKAEVMALGEIPASSLPLFSPPSPEGVYRALLGRTPPSAPRSGVMGTKAPPGRAIWRKNGSFAQKVSDRLSNHWIVHLFIASLTGNCHVSRIRTFPNRGTSRKMSSQNSRG